MLGSCSCLWLRRRSLPFSLVGAIFTRCLLLTVGSSGHMSIAGAPPSVHDVGNRPAASWSATGGREPDEEEAYVNERYAALLANIPERDLPAYRALFMGIKLYVRGADGQLYSSSTKVSTSYTRQSVLRMNG